MFYHAKNGRIAFPQAHMDYIRFGRGERTLILIPGIGDGLKTVKGAALPFALAYRKLAKEYTVYVFSAKEPLPDGYTTFDMAADIDLAMDRCQIRSALVVGASLGGMIAQRLAIDHPERVEKLILAVTLARPNECIRRVIRGWKELAKAGDYRGILIDSAEKSYSAARLKRMRRMYWLIGSVGKPKSFARFLVMADACVSHNAYERLPSIQCPTLVIGGTEDAIVSGAASVELAENIPGSALLMYDGLGHGAYEEANDFIEQIAMFFQ